MDKSAVYSWRLSPHTKAALEHEARRSGESMAALLDRVTEQWLRSRTARAGADGDDQARLHAAAARSFGTLDGGDPSRAERARKAVRSRLSRHRGRA